MRNKALIRKKQKFNPSREELKREIEKFLNRGGSITKLEVTKDTPVNLSDRFCIADYFLYC